MGKVNELLQAVRLADYPINKDSIQQTQRNKLRQELIVALISELENLHIVSHQVKDGIVIELPNDELGVIYALLKPTIKGLDYDLQVELDELQEKIDKQKEKEEKKNANANKRKK